ncbi:histone-like nucleoid-structuring protein Lsr2 [Miniimonas sp. S16]|uniref:Lsr2 family DNA-binding protein n=1 Tax=Miniimonas sp. S16 TaxID=2171623 RepID=UPI000D529C2A
MSEKNAAQLREAVAPFTSSGRRSGRAPRAKANSRGTGGDYDPKAVRIWAEANDVDVPARGRIPAAVLGQYRAAGN